MKRVKEAEHLSFPLQAKERGGVKSANEILAGFKPQNEMESAVQALLNKANLTEDELTKHEDLQMEAREMTEEEIKARRAELRYQRELLFRAEAKAKRVAKIKSKTFRKLARKRAAKENPEMALEDLERLDPEAAQIEREKIERERAIERATLRHGAKNRWARGVGGEADEDERMAKEAMLDMKEKLLRKIQGKDEGSSSEEESEDEDEDEETVKAKAFDQLAQLSADSGTASQAEGKKGLMQMKFMQKPQERRMKEVAEQEKDARMQIELFGEDGEREEESRSESDEEPAVVNVGRNEGRLKFTGPTPGVSSPLTSRLPLVQIDSPLHRPTPPNHQLFLPLQAKTPSPHPNPSPSLPVPPLPLLKNRTPGSLLPAPPAPLENVTLNLDHSLATRPRLLNLSRRQAREERMKKRMRRLISMWRHPSPPNQWRSPARWVRLRVRHLLLRLRFRRLRQRNRRKMRRLQTCFLPVVLKRSNNVILLLKHLRVIMLWRTLRLKRLGRLRRMLQRLKIPLSLDG